METNPDDRAPPRFVCTRCGNCCRGHGHVYLSDEDITRLAGWLGLDRDAFLRAYTEERLQRPVLKNQPNLDCIFLKGNDCVVHEVKPEQCARWPFWKTVATQAHAFDAARAYCHGLRDFDFRTFQRTAEREELFPNR
jgi:Fe-S-cluster containining protein